MPCRPILVGPRDSSQELQDPAGLQVAPRWWPLFQVNEPLVETVWLLGIM